jgi:hypothetical protein
VPFGEYVPLQDVLRGLIAFFDLPMSDFARGPADQAMLQAKGYQIAPFICYEVVYPEFAAGLGGQERCAADHQQRHLVRHLDRPAAASANGPDARPGSRPLDDPGHQQRRHRAD